jgi:hypothetical protein
MIRRGAGHVEREMPARWLEELVVAGDPEECVEKILVSGERARTASFYYPLRSSVLSRSRSSPAGRF